MRRELTVRLGVEWGPMHADSAEIAGVPTRLLREFSQRHEQIAEWLDTTGRSGPASRRTKRCWRPAPASINSRLRDARSRLADAGRTARLGSRRNSISSSLPLPILAPVDGGERWVIQDDVVACRRGDDRRCGRSSFEEWLDWLLTTRVTEKDGTFTRFDLTQAVAAELPAGTPIDRRRGNGAVERSPPPTDRPSRRSLDRAPPARRPGPSRRR